MNTEQLPAAYPLRPLQQADFGAGNMSWRESGKGECIVFLHGISSGSTAWARQLSDPELTSCYRLLAWDAPGYGESQALFNEHSADVLAVRARDYAKALHQWLNGLEIGQVILVGHSLGAMMASAFSAHYPDRVKGMILADPAQGYATADEAKRRAVYGQRAAQITELGPLGYAKQRAKNLLRAEPRQNDLLQVQHGMSRLKVKGFCQAAGMLAEDCIHYYLTACRVPMQVWCGDQDSITPPEDAERLAQRYQLPFYVLSDAGHASYLDAYEEFNRRLRQFCQIDAGSGEEMKSRRVS